MSSEITTERPTVTARLSAGQVEYRLERRCEGTVHYRSKVPVNEEASFAIGLTAELLTHAGHLLTAHPKPVKPERTQATTPATEGSTTTTASG